MDLPYKAMFNVGDHLILELSCGEIFEGNYSDGGKNRIDLVNTKQHNNTNELGGVYSFYRNEISKICKLKGKITGECDQSEATAVNCEGIKLIEEEYNRLKQVSKSAVYLECADSRYYEAVKKLSEAETVGVVSLGMEDGRTAVVKLLAISTWKQIFIFDLVNLKQRYFYQELKHILESEYITKVIHGGGPLVDILYRNYNIYVQNIFDTQVVDLIIKKSECGSCPKTTRNISQCVVDYFNFPASLLKDALEVPNKQWMERPLSDKRKLYASQLVVYCIVLKDYMQKILLSEVYKAIDNVHNLFYAANNYEFTQIVQHNKIRKEIDKVIPILTNVANEKVETKTNYVAKSAQ